MIEEKDIALIFKISQKGQLLDFSTIDSITNSIISKEDTITQNNYNGLIKDYDPYSYARYNKDEKLLYFGLDHFKESIPKDQDMVFSNLSLLQILLHEIEHIKEKSKIINGSPIEKCLLENSSKEVLLLKYISQTMNKNIFSNQILEDYLLNPNEENANNIYIESLYENCYEQIMKFYSKNHNLVPCERMADINSLNILINSLSQGTEFSKNFYYYIDLIFTAYTDALFDNYIIPGQNSYSKTMGNATYHFKTDILDPITQYCNALNIFSISENLKVFIDDFNSYSLLDRLLYGLPIYTEEITNDKVLKMSK